MELFDNNLTVMQRALDVRMDQQRVTAANIANVDTPGYIAQRLDFDATIQQAMANTDTPPESIIQDSGAPAVGLDGNNVDIDAELSIMSRNKMMYSVTAQLIAARMRQLATITEQSQ